jgi:hypothetical protein
VSGAGVGGAFGPVAVVAGAAHCAGVGAVPAGGVEVPLVGDVGADPGDEPGKAVRGKRPLGRRPGGARSGRCAGI